MESSAGRANALPAIEAAFEFLVSRYDYCLAQTTDIPSGAWYRAADRCVAVAYDFMRDAALDVRLEERVSGDSFLLSELLGLQAPHLRRRPGVRERAHLLAEIESTVQQLEEQCADFLGGDLAAFYRRHREAILVNRARALAHEEFYRGDPRRAARLFGCLREYWDDVDREHHDRALSGERPLGLLRAR